jgi:uncharacterized protein
VTTMQLCRASLAVVASLCASPALAANAGEDCPLARQPYSSRTVLLDLLIDPAARAVLTEVAPQVAKPPFSGATAWPTQPPTFAAIVTPEFMLRNDPKSAALIGTLDTALAKVPLTTTAVHARCARYDEAAPPLPHDISRPAILVFDKITGFRDSPSVDAAASALRSLAAQQKWQLVFTDKAAAFNARDLARFDAVVWNNVSGDVLTNAQREAFRSYMESGGGFIGVHGSGGDPIYVWDWYADTLIGARFVGHPANPQFQLATINLTDPTLPIAQGVSARWEMKEEWYSFASNPRSNGARVVATLDESTYTPVGTGAVNLRMGEHPIAWTNCVGNGRSFYTAIGHLPQNYSEPNSLRLLQNGIAWAAGLSESECRQGKEVARQ